MKATALPKRWPGKWCARARIWTSHGGSIGFEGPLPDEAGELLVALLVSSPTEDQRARMRALRDELCPPKEPAR